MRAREKNAFPFAYVKVFELIITRNNDRIGVFHNESTPISLWKSIVVRGGVCGSLPYQHSAGLRRME